MTPAILFPHGTNHAITSEVLRAVGCVLKDLGRPGDIRSPDESRINRRSVQPAIGHATISHEACVIILSTPGGAPMPGDRWMREMQFETGKASTLRLIASTAHDLAARVDSSVHDRKRGVPTYLADDLGAAAAMERARTVWMTRAPNDAIGICPETPWSPAAWIGHDTSRGDPVPNDVAALLTPLVEVRLVRTGTRSTIKMSALPLLIGPMDPVMRLRAIAAAEGDDA